MKFTFNEIVERTLECEYEVDTDKLKHCLGEEKFQELIDKIKTGKTLTTQEKFDLRGHVVIIGRPTFTDTTHEDLIDIEDVELLES